LNSRPLAHNARAFTVDGDGATRPFWMGVQKNYTETQQTGNAPKSGQQSKMEEVVPKTVR